MKFNTTKTEIIPIGTTQYHERVLNTRRLHPDNKSLHNSIHISADGKAVQSLRAWIGNKTNDTAPWEPLLDKIQNNLNKWSYGHPILDRKRLIIQMVVGGTTQFLTKVQGMPS